MPDGINNCYLTPKFLFLVDNASMFVCVCVCVCVCDPFLSHLGLPVYATPVATVLVETGDRRRKEEPPPLPPLVPLPQLLPIINWESTGPR